ncbi:MAG: DUF2851 family protein [Saprospiraceae bacterium]|nr:DUF2851 family protein [Saprospiraceae bacterium]
MNARIQVGTTIWVGNVEMHVRASDWFKHQHHKDTAYNNVILHVVYELDMELETEKIPCLHLQKRIAPKLLYQYQQLIENEYWIPCEARFHTISDLTKTLWLERLLVERLERKTQVIEQILVNSKNDWEETFYQFLARSFGLKVNTEPFEWLAQRTPLRLLLKHQHQLLQLEALLFGQAGFLEKEYADDYPRQLQQEYHFLKHKYKLNELSPTVWKFMRLRPPNFPTLRIAQLAMLIFQSKHLFSKVLETTNYEDFKTLFRVHPSDYWYTHYTFDKSSKPCSKKLGKNTVDLLLINTIAPFLFLYGSQRGITAVRDRAIQLLEQIPPEKNSIIEGWQHLNLPSTSAYHSQALIQLKNEYCTPKRCLTCAIGHALLR